MTNPYEPQSDLRGAVPFETPRSKSKKKIVAAASALCLLTALCIGLMVLVDVARLHRLDAKLPMHNPWIRYIYYTLP